METKSSEVYMQEIIENKYITQKNEHGDGITLCDGKFHEVKNVIVDFSSYPPDEVDEAIGITWGSSAYVKDCIFRNCGKLVLCGSGDEDKKEVEFGKKVTFENCIFENFGRRGPEVQSGMSVILKNCLIQNWGYTAEFTVRSFAGWAHGENSYIYAENCMFVSYDSRNLKQVITDRINHLGQAYNDEGIKGLFSKYAWTSGIKKALTATDGGMVTSDNCYVYPENLVIENGTKTQKFKVSSYKKTDQYKILMKKKHDIINKILGTGR